MTGTQPLLTPPAPPSTTHTDTTQEPPLWDEIRHIIDKSIASQPRELQTEIGPSELGVDCVHCLAAKLAGWQQHRTPAWLPFIGTSVHARLQAMFDQRADDGLFPYTGEDNVTELVERWRTEHKVTVGYLQGLHGGYNITGSIDLWDRQTNTTIDWKIVGETTLKQVREHGPSQQYRVQASLYGIGVTHEPGGWTITRSCIYYLPRNRPSLDQGIPVELPFDPQPGRWALSRAQLLVNLMDLIEQENGIEVRDAWIHTLPTSPSRHCFDCGTWDDDLLGDYAAINPEPRPAVPGKWTDLIPVIEPEYPAGNDK